MGLLDLAVSDKIRRNSDKLKTDQEKAEKQVQATKINSAILELAKTSGSSEELEGTSKVLEAIGNSDPDVSKIVYGSIESRIKDKLNYEQTLQTEGFKAKMSFIPEITKSMAQSGMYSPEQIQNFAGIATEKAQAGIAGRINQVNQQAQVAQPTAEPGVANELFSNPLPQKMTAKQQDYKDTLDRGLTILDETEKQYNFISENYGTGRIKGVATELMGKAGDLMPLIGGKEVPEVVPYMNNLEGLANFIGKTVYRDERVSDVNIKGYKKALAELTNTPEEAKIMFATLRSYASGRGIKDEIALRYMTPKDGKAMKPSEAVKLVTGKNPFSKLSREDKIALLKKKKQNAQA